MSRRPIGIVRVAAAVVALLAVASAAQAQSSRPEPDFDWELPTDPKLWSNSPPLTLESLAGKGVVFFYFSAKEPERPRLGSGLRASGSREREEGEQALWTELQRLSANYKKDPVLFVGVGQFDDPRDFGQYLRKNRVQWPVIADRGGALANQMGVPRLGGRNAANAVKVLSGSGSFRDGVATSFDETTTLALEDAAWRVDPAAIPSQLRAAWRSIELGDFNAAARAVNKAIKGRDPDLKAAADLLFDAVRSEAEPLAVDAEKALGSDDQWGAYKHLDTLVTRFEGYESLVGVAEEKLKELSESDAVKDELVARNLFRKARDQQLKGTTTGYRRAKSTLERLVEKHPDTEAAADAQEALAVLTNR